MKTCPYCAEEIKKEAIKCKHCHSMLDNEIAIRSSTPETAPIKESKITANYVQHKQIEQAVVKETPKPPIDGFTFSELQILDRKLSKHLRIGVFFTILWLGGVGSLIGLINGIDAHKIVKQTQGKLGGGFGAWFCILLGAGGLAFWGVILLGAFVG